MMSTRGQLKIGPGIVEGQGGSMEDRLTVDMTHQGWHLLAREGASVQRYQVLGERSSGTNFIQWMIDENSSLTYANRDPLKGNALARKVSKTLGLNIKEKSLGPYGWKHGFPTFPTIGRKDLVIVSFRNLFDWLVSMYAKPWHIDDGMLSLSFREFIRAEWDARVDRPTRYFDMPNAQDFEGLPLRLDRHPITGQRFSNILQMRNLKTQAYLGLAHQDGNVAFCRHEAFTARPEAVLRDMANLYGFGLRKAGRKPPARMGAEWKYDAGERYQEARSSIKNERDFILSQIDLTTEARLGYAY
ncbi:hypothetical protein RGQ15_15275 [Paracoccus sp. MBLB3053]|uniref:Sulfotransferase domain-containing protein n=1 Tax=Paracoccus aurantius TaxID=3073814 RepID=A0ABU2HV50_9RHOB|nr:hypothetical protein [Paracoccus sp. MBLB3053]MDS9468927.1 hypothetical protein [Paracoccus sp. MBLB3053]